jgi:hypothetical protein
MKTVAQQHHRRRLTNSGLPNTAHAFTSAYVDTAPSSQALRATSHPHISPSGRAGVHEAQG